MTVNDEPAVFQVKHGLDPDFWEAALGARGDLAVHLDLVVHGEGPDSVLHVHVAEGLGGPGAVVEVVLGHHGVLGVSARLEIRNSQS